MVCFPAWNAKTPINCISRHIVQSSPIVTPHLRSGRSKPLTLKTGLGPVGISEDETLCNALPYSF